MKKSVLLAILFLFVVFLARTSSSLAATPADSPTPSVSPSVAPGPNPGPPIGIPCGNTVCLPGESCVQFPGDKDLHCVPDGLLPTPSLTPSISPTPSLTPTITIVPSPTLPPQCPAGTGVFPPNSSCWNDSRETQKDITKYAKTCIYQPVIRYTDNRSYRSGDQSFKKCGKGVGPHGEIGPGGNDPECDVALLINTNVRDAEIAGYGPSNTVEDFFTSDYTAQNYLYNAVFGRPLDLSDTNREAYRTYWRLLPAYNQANLRSFVMNMASDGQIDNIKFEFTDVNGLQKQTDFKSLFEKLKNQIIVFWHFPFIRIGCLTQYPVCPEYAQAIKELKPNFEEVRKAIRDLDLGALAEAPLNFYESIISAPPFNGDLDGPYAAFVPLDFNSVRSYILKKKDTKEEAAYEYFKYFHLPFYKLTNVSFESVPYVGAIYQGLLSPKFGMIPALQPQWITEKYSGSDGLSDYRIGNTPQDLPEVKIAKRNFFDQFLEEAQAFRTNPFGWLSSKVLSFFTGDDRKKGYIDNTYDVYTNPLRIDEVRQVYDNPVGCPLPLSYHQISPKTAAKSIDDHHQVVIIPGQHLAWSYKPTCRDLSLECRLNPVTGLRECGTGLACSGKDQYVQDGQCCSPSWEVEATRDAKAFDVLNNPKQTDIQEAVANNPAYAFYNMMLPDGSQEIPEAKIDAPIAKNTVVKTAPNGKGEVLNPAEPINRVSNLAQDAMHYLQNCWTVPGGLQNSPRCLLSFPEETNISACNGEAFAKIVGDPAKPSPKAEDFFKSSILPKLTEDVIAAYAAAEEQTGVPCEVLAGIHFEEAGNSPTQDLQSGQPLMGRSLKESAIQAAEELKQKAGGSITSLDQLIKAMSWYNGGGNSNCQASKSFNCPAASSTDRCGMTVACSSNPGACSCAPAEANACRPLCSGGQGGGGFPYQFSYNYCPPSSTGYDDPYVTNWWVSPQHDNMYLLYMYDCTQTRPQIHIRPGSLTVAISLYLTEKQQSATTQSSPTTQP